VDLIVLLVLIATLEVHYNVLTKGLGLSSFVPSLVHTICMLQLEGEC